jgi:transposase
MNNDIESKSQSGSSVGVLEGARRATGENPTELPALTPTPNPEVHPGATRRRFSAKYKRSILDQVDQCNSRGDIGALLRREGLYSSHLTNWRRQRDTGALAGLSAQKRGRKPDPAAAERLEIAKLKKENERLQLKLKKAHTIIEFQKKLSEILEIPMDISEMDKTS